MKSLSLATRQSRPDIPWNRIVGTRDRLIHGYFTVDFDIVWEIVETELPKLRTQIASLVPRG